MSFPAPAIRTSRLSTCRVGSVTGLVPPNVYRCKFHQARRSQLCSASPEYAITESTGALSNLSACVLAGEPPSGKQEHPPPPKGANGRASAVANIHGSTNVAEDDLKSLWVLHNGVEVSQRKDDKMPRQSSKEERIDVRQGGKGKPDSKAGVVFKRPDTVGDGKLKRSRDPHYGRVPRNVTDGMRKPTPGYHGKSGNLPSSPNPLVQISSDVQLDREPWQVQKRALSKKFGSSGWSPRKRLSPDSLEGIRALHAQYPDKYTTPVLADYFKVSPEAIRRILKSKWRPNDDEEQRRRDRWNKRGASIWGHMNELGIKPPRKWRDQGVCRSEIHESVRNERPGATRKNLKTNVWSGSGRYSEDSPTMPAVNRETAHPISMTDKIL